MTSPSPCNNELLTSRLHPCAVRNVRVAALYNSYKAIKVDLPWWTQAPGDISLLSAHVTKERIDRPAGSGSVEERKPAAAAAVPPFILLHTPSSSTHHRPRSKHPPRWIIGRIIERSGRRTKRFQGARYYSTRRGYLARQSPSVDKLIPRWLLDPPARSLITTG